jgi:hypothetical protein
MKYSESDNALTVDITSVISKSILYICLSVISGMWIYSCKIDSDVIDRCKSACGMTMGIREVTSTKCECNKALSIEEISSNPWVLPR